MIYVTRNTLERTFRWIGNAADEPGFLYLVGETSLVWEGARSWTDEIEVALVVGDDEQARPKKVRDGIVSELGMEIVDEFPGDVVPLPDSWRENCRRIEQRVGTLELAHFDPYSVSFRFLARGDEEDYRLVVSYLELGWVDMKEMDRQLERLLPRFTFQTIAQDPAEFRRKYKGLEQMARARGLI